MKKIFNNPIHTTAVIFAVMFFIGTISEKLPQINQSMETSLEEGISATATTITLKNASASQSIVKGDTVQLKVKSVPKKATVKWKSSKPKVVKITSKGKIRALKTGTSTITASYTKNGRTIKRKIRIKVVKATLNKTSVNLKEGKYTTLKINSAQNTTKWKSSNTSVAKVTSKGKVTAVKKGTAYITATYHGKKYKTKVTVTAQKTTDNNNKEDGNGNNGDDTGGGGGGDTGNEDGGDDPAPPNPPTPPIYVWPDDDITDEALYISIYQEVDEVLAMVNTGRYTEDSFAKTKEIAAYYDSMRNSYTTLAQLQADIDKYSSPKAYLVCAYKEEYNSYPEIAKLVFDEINNYRNETLPDEEEVVLQGTTVKKYNPDYIWNDECAKIAQLQSVYNLKARAAYPDLVGDGVYSGTALHGGYAIGYSGVFINVVTDEEKWYQVTGADGLAKVAVSAWKASPTHISYLRQCLSQSDVEKELNYYCGVSVTSHINDAGVGYVNVIVEFWQAKEVVDANGNTVYVNSKGELLSGTCNPSKELHTFDGVDIPLGTSLDSPECVNLLSDVREITEASLRK